MRRRTVIALGLSLIGVLALASCFGYVPGRTPYWDSKIEELCEKDGGTRILEVVELPRHQYSTLLNRVGELDIPVERYGYGKNETALIVGREAYTIIREGNPEVRRTELQIVRNADKRLLATRVTYTRTGGEFNPPTIAHRPIPTFQCPSREFDTNLYAKVIKESAPKTSSAAPLPEKSAPAEGSFRELCKSAGFTMKARLPATKGVLLDRSKVVGQAHYRYAVPPGARRLLELASIEYVDELTTTGTRYRRELRNGSQSIETETAADLLLRIEPIVSGEAQRAGMFGNEIALIDRSTGSKLSTFRYFWKMSPYEICPTGKDPQGPHTQMIAAYMIGLRDPSKEEMYRINWIP